MKNQAFLRHAAVYGLATLLVQAAGFVLLPLYTRCMSKVDFGALEVAGRLAETVGTVLLFGGLRQALLARKIESGIHYKPNHLLTYYGGGKVRLPIAEKLYEDLLTLPLHTELTDEEQDRVVEVVRRILNE